MQVLVATRDPEVLATVRKHPDAQEVPALDTGNVYKAIPDIQLAIIDYRDLFARPFSVDLIRRLLDESGVPQCSSSEFKQSPGSYLDRRYPKGRTLPLLEQRTIAFTSYSGGTGKTSLALDTAYRFVERTRNAWLELPAAVFELTYGGSALKALVGERQPTIDELVEQPEREPFRLHGFTLYPMEYGRLQQVDRERVIDYMRKQMGQHVLTILDTSWPHGFAQDLGADVDLWIVVATPRIDAVENAQHLREQLAREYGERRVITVLNQMGTFGDRLAVWGTSYQLEIQKTKQTGVLF
ncbi:MAG: hypothetical protein FJZ90_16975, partial [Chloroflexi bacterium]|nr:hypothetical protein [Chloroflexota bacterium]